ncbi:hypothetical protein Lmor_1477 [Legionella moravica]|uniref:Transmembrane protein n=1 Tax=Legionella moravica TaxID=39962 RepID=A0A378K7J4_9GAMM|nr:hypothetical protein [Legionella moravica]KTD34944.1 hypothetical protein Lmor_1477 [Legionella moravica]STX63811.1 Uncharacterised protein [Legionella moravica]
MSDKLKQVFENFIPFIAIGVGIAIVVGLLFMFFYVAIWGVVIGGVLYLVAVAKQYFFPSESSKKEEGRIIEHDDKK